MNNNKPHISCQYRTHSGMKHLYNFSLTESRGNAIKSKIFERLIFCQTTDIYAKEFQTGFSSLKRGDHVVCKSIITHPPRTHVEQQGLVAPQRGELKVAAKGSLIQILERKGMR